MSNVTDPTISRAGTVRSQLTGSGAKALALVVVLAAIGVGSAATLLPSAAAAPAGEAGGDHRPSAWAEASGAASAPSLLNDVAEPEGDAGAQLPVGLGLVGLGVLMLGGYGLTAQIRNGPGAQTRRDAYAGNSRRARFEPAESPSHR